MAWDFGNSRAGRPSRGRHAAQSGDFASGNDGRFGAGRSADRAADSASDRASSGDSPLERAEWDVETALSYGPEYRTEALAAAADGHREQREAAERTGDEGRFLAAFDFGSEGAGSSAADPDSTQKMDFRFPGASQAKADEQRARERDARAAMRDALDCGYPDDGGASGRAADAGSAFPNAVADSSRTRMMAAPVSPDATRDVDFDMDAALRPSERYSQPSGSDAVAANFAMLAGVVGRDDGSVPAIGGIGEGGNGAVRARTGRAAGGGTGTTGSAPRDSHSPKARSGRAGKIVLIVLAVLIVAVGACGLGLKFSIDKVLDEKTNAVTSATTYIAGMKTGDAAAIQAGSAGLQSSVDAICDELNGPLWSLASVLPVAGEEVRNARTMLDTAKELVDEAAVPLGTYFAAHPISSLVVGHGVDATELRNLVNEIQKAAPVITKAAETLSALPESRISQISSLQQKIAEPLEMVGELFQNNGTALAALPGMLGADGDRTYLLVAQTYAEVRSEGGFPGQVIEIHVSNGVIEIGQSEGIADLCTYCFAEPQFSAGQSPEAIAVFSESVDWHPGDFTMDPDFTHVGETYHRAWIGYKGTDVNGVITMDVPFLQMLVQTITDTLVLGDGSVLASASISDELIHNTYVTYGDNDTAHEEHFNLVMDACISTVFGGFASCDTTSFLKAVLQGIEDHRLMGWMTDASEQAAMATLGMDGSVSTDPTTAELGVYYNNKTYGKIDWYLSRRNILHGSVKNADGSTTYTVSTILTNNCTWEEAATLPTYIVGSNYRAPGDMTTDLVLYAPAGGTVSNVRMGGTEQAFGMNAQWVYGINAVYGTFSLAPGATLQVTYDVTTSAQATDELELRQTPMSLNESMDFEKDEGIAPATNGIGL